MLVLLFSSLLTNIYIYIYIYIYVYKYPFVEESVYVCIYHGRNRCNTDAAWKSGKAGMAWIFTNREGLELKRGSIYQDHISLAVMAEAIAIRNALLQAVDLNITHIWLRSDSQVLIGALSSGRHPTELYGVLSDISTISRSSFISCSFSFINRECNGLADLHAKACLHSGPNYCNS